MGTQNILYQKEDNTIFIGLNITVIFKSKQNKTSHEQIYSMFQNCNGSTATFTNFTITKQNIFSVLVLCTQVNMMLTL